MGNKDFKSKKKEGRRSENYYQGNLIKYPKLPYFIMYKPS